MSTQPESIRKLKCCSEQAIFRRTPRHKAVDRRSTVLLDASIIGQGAGEGFGVDTLAGPIAVEGAQPYDIFEVDILNTKPRPSHAPEFAGRSFGCNAGIC